MTRSKTIEVATAAALLYAFAPFAMAQSAQVEIDFTSVLLPLSPALTALVAITLGALGIIALRKTRGRARLVSWLVISLAALPVAMQANRIGLMGVAHAALPAILVSLSASPSITPVTFPTYIATNVTGGNITLTAVELDNAGSLTLFAPLTTCVVGLSLAPHATCVVVVNGVE